MKFPVCSDAYSSSFHLSLQWAWETDIVAVVLYDDQSSGRGDIVGRSRGSV